MVMHQSIKGVTEDTQRFHFNTSVSRIMELTNELYKYVQERNPETFNRELLETALNNLVLLLAPFVPHLAEEFWQKLGNKPTVFDQAWPEYNEAYLKVDEIDWVIQVNGKIRQRITASATLTKEQAEALAMNDERIKELLDGKTIRKVIVVPKKLVNIVAS